MPTKSFARAKILGRNDTISIDNLSDDLPITEVITSIDDLPASGALGEQAFVEGSNRLYMWNGTGWYNVALINETPAWDSGGQPNATYDLSSDSPQSSTTVTLAASDPEGLPINYSYITGGSMDSIATVSQDSSVFTITPKTSAQAPDGGTGTITFRASDGVNILPYQSTFTLTFIVEMNDIDNSTLTRTTNLQAQSGRTIGGLSFSADGTKFIAGMKTSDPSNPACWYYTLTTPWDLSTGTRQSTTFGVDSWTLQNVVGVNVNSGQWFTGWHMTSDGAYLFTTEAYSAAVRRWDFGTPYDPTTLTYSGYTTNFGSGAARNSGVYLSPDGHNLFISNHYYDYVAHVYLSTAFRPDTSGTATIGYISDNVIQDVILSDTGLKLFTVSETNNVIRQWNLSTAWDLHSTSSGTDQLGTGDYTYSVGSQQAVCLNTADGDEFFVGNGLAVKTYAT